jgi:adenylate cyclase
MTGTDTTPAELLHRLAGLEPPRYRRADVARLTGVDHAQSVRWWRAMGFPEVPDDVTVFVDTDLEMIRRLAALSAAGLVDARTILRLARLLGASFSRIADAQVAAVEELGATVRASPVEALDETVLDLLETTMVYVWRRHLVAALGRRLDADEAGGACAVGFVDLSGFTKLSARVSADRLAELVDEFERVAFDAVSVRGGRAVKILGDEVMFVAESLAAAVDVALDISARLRDVDDMPATHSGVAYGPAVSVGGDVFGATVNLAARLTAHARAGTLLVPRAQADELRDRPGIDVVPVRRSLDLKGIGATRVSTVRRAGRRA